MNINSLVLDNSYKYRLGHIPSALSLLPILKNPLLKEFPIILGKTFGVQAWFFDENIKKNFLKSQRKILSVEDFSFSQFHVVYCQDMLGIAAGFAVGYSIANNMKPCICILSDGDVFLSSTIQSIRYAYVNSIPVKYVIDYNKIQLFNENDCYPLLKDYSPVFDYIPDTQRFSISLFHTKKGMGIPDMESHPHDYHYKILSQEEYTTLRQNLSDVSVSENNPLAT